MKVSYEEVKIETVTFDPKVDVIITSLQDVGERLELDVLELDSIDLEKYKDED